jgi:hypothetical protein
MSPERSEGGMSRRFLVGGDLNWGAPWIDVTLWVELPFWLMVNNATYLIEVDGHGFQVALHDDYFELYGGEVSDSKRTVCYRGPVKRPDDMSRELQQLRKDNPGTPFVWRKCKTVLKIATRCNRDVWSAAATGGELRRATIDLYLAELCRAHIPVVNRLIQAYRLATYDYFPFEVAPWDLPHWVIERGGQAVNSLLVPYRGWDIKPLIKSPSLTRQLMFYQLIEDHDLRDQISATGTPGEFELLDALNFMEKGDYSGAVRRITTAVEVLVEAVVATEIERAEGKQRSAAFILRTRTNFPARVKKYEEISGRALAVGLQTDLDVTRKLRHRIVHQGYRITSGQRGRAQRSVDTGRWIFNWFENNEQRRKIREERIGFRSFGRDLTHGIFSSSIIPDGVNISPHVCGPALTPTGASFRPVSSRRATWEARVHPKMVNQVAAGRLRWARKCFPKRRTL